MKEFGVVTKNECNFELYKLKSDAQKQLPLDANVFFELFLEDRNKNLVAVPVAISNFRDIDGSQPNITPSGQLDPEKSRLMHRFFMYDTVSGIENTGGYAQNELPKVVRLATSVKLTVELDPIEPESIKKPLLTISYQEEKTSKVRETTLIPAVFFMDYYEGISTMWRVMKWILIVANVFIVMIIAARMYFFIKHNPPNILGPRFTQVFI